MSFAVIISNNKLLEDEDEVAGNYGFVTSRTRKKNKTLFFWLWVDLKVLLFFKVFFYLKIYQNNIFFIF